MQARLQVLHILFSRTACQTSFPAVVQVLDQHAKLRAPVALRMDKVIEACSRHLPTMHYATH